MGDRKLCVVCSRLYDAEHSTCPDDGAPLVDASDEGSHKAGDELGNYRLVRLLGEGGAGAVWEAEHVRLGRKMAIKILHSDAAGEHVVARFFNEARAVNAIKHPNIIDIEDFVTTPDGEYYLVMELLTGLDLRQAIGGEGRLDFARITSIGAQVASALAAVHAVGIVHRDLKPDNIFLVERDGREVPKLLDFGVAKFLDQEGVTRAGMTVGTPAYMAPEQIMKGKAVNHRSDIYALGMVLYEAIVGSPAFEGPSIAAVLRGHCLEPVPSMSKRRGEAVPRVLEAAILKCLAKEPDDRFDTADQLVAALRAERPVTVAGMRTRSRSRAIVVLPAIAMIGAAIALQLMPRDDKANAAPTAKVASAGSAPCEPEHVAPAAKPGCQVTAVDPDAIATAMGSIGSSSGSDRSIAGSSTPVRAATISVSLVSDPPGAAMFLDDKPLGRAPVTVEIPVGDAPVRLVARFPDGPEVVQTIVPDRPRSEIQFAKPKQAPRPPGTGKGSATVPATPDREGTIDPFKQPR